MADVYIDSPQRPPQAPSRVRTPNEQVANFVEQIPEVNVTFAEGVFILKTQRYGAVNDMRLSEELQSELDQIAKNVERNLKDEEYKKVKVKPIDFDCTPMGWGSGIHGTGRTILYVSVGTYELIAEV